MELNEIGASIIALVGLFLISISCGLTPILLADYSTCGADAIQRVFGFLNSFAGGVILATAMVHLLPEVRQEMLLASDYVHPTIPVAESIACAGILLMLILEQTLLIYAKRMTKSCPAEDIPLTSSTDYNYDGTDNQSSDQNHGNDIHTLENEKMEGLQSGMRSFVFFVALCVHGMFASITLGQLNDPTDIIILFAGLACHEGPISFSLGVNIQRGWFQKTATVVMVCLHAFVFPIGIGIGLGISKSSTSTHTKNLASGVLQGFGIGTLLYMTFFEILPREFNNSEHRMAKIVCTLIGFAVIVTIQYVSM
ncbi:zinc transporter ZIP3-like [Glandiceps talaboti]